MQVARKNMNFFFPTPVWSVEFADFEVVNRSILEELSALDWEALGRQSLETYGPYHTYSEDRFATVEQVPSMRVVLDHFMATCRDIANELNWDLSNHELFMTTYWVHATEPGDLTGQHTHSPSVLSGVYYLDKPANSGDIMFTDYNPFHAFGPPIKPSMSNPLGGADVVFPANDGTMLIFPAWLPHKVAKNRSDRRRVSLSFNAGLASLAPS